METRNLILAIVLSVGVLLLWTVFIEAPRQQINQSIESGQQDSIGEIAELETEELELETEGIELEDEEVVQEVQKGVSSRFYKHGRFSPSMERGVHHFHTLMSNFINT